MILNEAYTLSNGVKIPRLGLGTWFIPDEQAAQAVRTAVSLGYRHFDTAQACGNEAGVGEGKLSARLRELVILAVAAANQTMNEVRRHTIAALASGVKPEEIKEAVYHCAPYIGLGKAENAVNAVNEAFAERGIALPLTSGQTVTEESRLADGIAAQKSIFGVQIDAMRAAAPEDQKKIQDDLSAYCFGDFYTRRFLTIPERELLTFAILAAQGGCEPQVRAHVGGNAAVGNGRETLLAALTVCLPYIGFPRTLNALSCINEVLP